MTTTWQDGNVITSTFMNQAQRRIEAVASVDDPAYGAVGDGTTDDTAAIQAAFAANKTVQFSHGKTYLVTSPIYLSKEGSTILVEKIFGNGATILFKDFVNGSLNYSSVEAGFWMGAKDTGLTGEYSGWQGEINDLNFEVENSLIFCLGAYGARFKIQDCSFYSRDNLAVGGLIGRNLINCTLDNCYFDFRNVCSDSTGAGNITNTDVNGDYTPSSCCIFLYPRWPQGTTTPEMISSAPAYPQDNVRIAGCIIVGGTVGVWSPGAEGQAYTVIENSEIAYNHYGLLTNNGNIVTGNWFENSKYSSIQVNAVTPPWHTGYQVRPLIVMGNSFSPHNTPGSIGIDIQQAPQSMQISNNFFFDCTTAIKDRGTTAVTCLLVNNTSAGATDDISSSTKYIKINHYNGHTVDFSSSGFKMKEGSNCRMGLSTLSGGTVVVANTSVTASTRVFCSRMTTGGTTGDLSVVLNAGVGFTINSSSGTDTSTVAWMLVEPA